MTRNEHILGLMADGFTDAAEIAEIVGCTAAAAKRVMERNAYRCRQQKLEDHRRYLLTKAS